MTRLAMPVLKGKDAYQLLDAHFPNTKLLGKKSLDQCFVCGIEIDTAKKSHSIPRSWLKNIADAGGGLYYAPMAYLMIDRIPHRELSHNTTAGVFRALCDSCEKSLSYEESPKSVLTQTHMREIASKELMHAFYSTKIGSMDNKDQIAHARRYEMLYRVAQVAEFKILHEVTVPKAFKIDIAGHVITTPLLPSTQLPLPWTRLHDGEKDVTSESPLIFLVFRQFKSKTKITLFGHTSSDFRTELKSHLRNKSMEEMLAIFVSWLFQSQGNFAYGFSHMIPFDWFLELRYEGPWVRLLLGEDLTYEEMEDAWAYHLELTRRFVDLSRIDPTKLG